MGTDHFFHCYSAMLTLPKHAPRWIKTCFTFLYLTIVLCSAQQQIIPSPRITDVTAMCSVDGITAQIMFDGPFFGKIYSKNYAAVHDCVYYNLYEMNMILFTIPNFKCGTKLTRNVRNLVNRIENEVYVQYDKDTQTGEDKRFLFICELSSSSGGGFNGNGNTDGGSGGFSGTVRPGQTVIVESIQPTRIVATQTSVDRPDVIMEIQDGVGPFQPPVSRSLKLGDVITLVVKSRQQETSQDQYNMFVHSCYAADGTGSNQVQLIDRSGCTVRPQVAGRLQRTKLASGDILYYFRMSAFKFPGPNDVYFSCSVDICSDCNFPKICPISGRIRRSIKGNGDSIDEEEKDDQVLVHDYVTISDQDDNYTGNQSIQQYNPYCFSGSLVWSVTACMALLLSVLIAMTVVMLSTTLRRRRSNKSSNDDDIEKKWNILSHFWNESGSNSNNQTSSLTTVS